MSDEQSDVNYLLKGGSPSHHNHHHLHEGEISTTADGASPQIQRWKFTTVLNNETILLTTIIIVATYVIVCVVVMLKKRRQVQKQNEILVIKQTSKNNAKRHPYLITVVTGNRCDAGTLGFVQMRLSGKDKLTQNFYLNPFLHDPHKEKFQRFCTDKFVLFANDDLGELFLAEIELQSQDPTSWYLGYIIVQDVITLTQWYFPHHDWLHASDGADSLVCRVALIAGVDSHLRLLKDNFMRGFRKHHVWYKMVSHVAKSSRFNALLSLTYCHSLSMCFMCANAITTGIIMTKNARGPHLDMRQTVLYTTGANAIVSVIMSALEVAMVKMEHRNRFDHLEYQGRISVDSIFSTTKRLQKVDSSVWKDEPDSYYRSYGTYDGQMDEENGYNFRDVYQTDFNRPDMQQQQQFPVVKKPLRSIRKDSEDSLTDTISINGSDHMIKTNGLWTHGDYTSDQFRSSLDSPYGGGMARQLARASDINYMVNHEHDESVKKNISWNDAAELFVYSKRRPVSKGQAPFKAIVPVISPRARSTYYYQPVYTQDQQPLLPQLEEEVQMYGRNDVAAGSNGIVAGRNNLVASGNNVVASGNSYQRSRAAGDVYRNRDEMHPSAFRPVIDYESREAMMDDESEDAQRNALKKNDCKQEGMDAFTRMHSDMQSRMDDIDQKYAVEESCQTDEKIDDQVEKSQALKQSLTKEVRENKKNANISGDQVKDDDKIIQDVFLKRIKKFIQEDISNVSKKEDNVKITKDKATVQKNTNEKFKNSLQPMISSFVSAVQESVLKRKDIKKDCLKDFESGILKLLQQKSTKEVKNKENGSKKVTDREGEKSNKKKLKKSKQKKQLLPNKVSSLTKRSSSSSFEIHGHGASDTVLSSGHSLKKEVSSEDNVVSSDTTCNKAYQGSSQKNKKFQDSESSLTSSKASITEIHDAMNLGPVSRKLSDAVLGCAYNQNMERVEKKADEIIRLSKKSREHLIGTLCKALKVDIKKNEIEEKLKTKPSTDSVASEKSVEVNAVEKKSSSQMIVEKIPKKLVPKITDAHVMKTATASLQSILSEDINQRFKDIVGDFSKSEMNEFASDVVGSLYVVVREKLKKMIALDMEVNKTSQKETDEGNKEVKEKWKQFNKILESADKEIKMEILPIVTEHITTLIEEEAHTLETLDVDLMMMAYGGQFIDTVVTNAVLQTHVGLIKGAKTLLESKDKNKDGAKPQQKVDVKVTEMKPESDQDSSIDGDYEGKALISERSVDKFEDVNEGTQTEYGDVDDNEPIEDYMANNQGTYVSYATLDGHNITGSNANELSETSSCNLSNGNATSPVNFGNVTGSPDSSNSFQNLVALTQKKLATQCPDVCSLNMTQVLEKVFDTVHEKLGHKSLEELECYDEARSIHCALCKPKAVKNISERLVGMSAATYITKEVFAKAIKSLNELQEKSDILKDFCFVSADSSTSINEDNMLTMLKKIGEILAKTDTESSSSIKEHERLVEDIVSDLTEYIVENACDDVASGLINLMELQYAGDEVPKDMSAVIERKVRNMLTKKSHQCDEENAGCHNNINYTAFNDGVFDDFLENDKYKTNVKDLTADLSEIRRIIAPMAAKPNANDDNSADLPDTTYHTYHYDDKDRYRVGLQPWIFKAAFVFLFVLTFAGFLTTILIGVGLSAHIANHWYASVIIAIFQHMFVLEPMKILFLAIFATYCGNRLL